MNRYRKRSAPLFQFLLVSLAVHLGIAGGFGGWAGNAINNSNLGRDREEVILLEIGWSEVIPQASSAKRPIVKKEKDKKEVQPLKNFLSTKEKIKEKIKEEKKADTSAEKSAGKLSRSLGQKSGRSGKEKVTSQSGNNSYLEEVRRRIEKAKFYPPRAKMARLEGEVTLEFQIDKFGKAKNVNLTRFSKYKTLNLAARKILDKASPFPKPKDSAIIGKTIETTLVFELSY